MKRMLPVIGTLFRFESVLTMPRHAPRQWLLLFALTAVCTYAMQLVQFPASSLLGGMCAGILVALYGGGMQCPRILFQFGQGIIGLMIGLRMPPNFFDQLRHSWPLFLGGVAWAVVAAALLGWLLTKWRIFPGTTAIWGLSPGAASTMTVMSESYGGDIRLVAFMQYFRNVSVVVVTSLVARFWVGSPSAPPVAEDWLVMPDWPRLGLGVVVIACCLAAAKKLRMSSGNIIIPMAVGILFNYTGAVRVDTPPWFLSLGSMLIGWSIGMRFTREILRQIAHSLPSVAFAVFSLIALCGLFSAFMVWHSGIAPLTAYLAACPGGLDSVSIIAASAPVDISFVLAMHTARFLLVVVTGPFLARQIVTRAYGRKGKKHGGE